MRQGGGCAFVGMLALSAVAAGAMTLVEARETIGRYFVPLLAAVLTFAGMLVLAVVILRSMEMRDGETDAQRESHERGIRDAQEKAATDKTIAAQREAYFRDHTPRMVDIDALLIGDNKPCRPSLPGRSNNQPRLTGNRALPDPDVIDGVCRDVPERKRITG